jgi:hypothetical protein
MPCCPHCIEHFDEGDDSQPCCGACGHPLTCPRGCRPFEEADGTLANHAKALGRALRNAATRLGPEHPCTILARLNLFELYVDAEWEGFPGFAPAERDRVVACADQLLGLELTLEKSDAGAAVLERFRLRLARIYLDVGSAGKGEALARRALGAIGTRDGRLPDGVPGDLSRLARTCRGTHQLPDVAEACCRRVIAHLEWLGGDCLDPLDCLQQVLTAAGRTEEAQQVAARLRSIRGERDALKRERFRGTLNALRREWELQDRQRRTPRRGPLAATPSDSSFGCCGS